MRMKFQQITMMVFVGSAIAASAPAVAWEPSRTVEFIVPAGPGGGADQMARFIQGMVAKHKLMNEPMVVINMGGGAGAEGFLAVKEAKGDPNKLAFQSVYHADGYRSAV